MHDDKNEYGQKVAIMVGDYIDLFFEAKKLAFEHIPDQGRPVFEESITNLLDGIKGKKPRNLNTHTLQLLDI